MTNQCPFCGKIDHVVREEREIDFKIGYPRTLDRKLVIPVSICHACEMEWTGPEAEDIRAHAQNEMTIDAYKRTEDCAECKTEPAFANDVIVRAAWHDAHHPRPAL